jgi:DNA-directed RNA polymerase alpha subunit
LTTPSQILEHQSSACGKAGLRDTYEDRKMTDTGAIPKSAPRSRKADDRWMKSLLRGQKFEGRGFSRRTIDALLAHGISAPERLLFMTETELQNIPGIGAISLGEIARYRNRHLSGA